jgi:2-oxoglutarate ferredoxin oxidoreductase subunit beta
MSTPPQANVNRIGLTAADYKGSKSTLCPGCGHDAITGSIIQAAFELGLEQHKVAKMSGIGCSSKTPAYFLGRSHSFNAVHGRMPSVATGAHLANRELIMMGVSGDGDSASIGLGQFLHLVRRNVPIVYIIENNGVYGLTKGQFSATADVGTRAKSGQVNEMMPIDLCEMAIQLGCGFVARSFSGDPKQLRPLLKAAFSHRGTSVLDVISPCVTFNNHEGSTKSFDYVREHNEAVNRLDIIPEREEITADYAPGTVEEIVQHNGGRLRLRKLSADYDPHDRIAAMRYLQERHAAGEIVTGVLYLDPEATDLHDDLNTVDTPLNQLTDAELCPGAAALESFNDSLR